MASINNKNHKITSINNKNNKILTSINNKNPNILTKRPPVATVPSGTQRHHWGIGIPGYTFGSSIQARAIPPPSWVSNGRPHLQLYRKGAYIHYLCLYSENTVKKGVLFDES